MVACIGALSLALKTEPYNDLAYVDRYVFVVRLLHPLSLVASNYLYL